MLDWTRPAAARAERVWADPLATTCHHGGVAFTVLLCTDGSELSRAALAEGLRVLAPADRVVVATAVETADPMLVTGTGFAGGVMSAEELQRDVEQRHSSAQAGLDATCAALGLVDAETTIVLGAPGSALCDLAAALPASVVVLGTRGHGGLRRAILGSVSDHVVRHAPCPVVTVGPA